MVDNPRFYDIGIGDPLPDQCPDCGLNPAKWEGALFEPINEDEKLWLQVYRCAQCAPWDGQGMRGAYVRQSVHFDFASAYADFRRPIPTIIRYLKNPDFLIWQLARIVRGKG